MNNIITLKNGDFTAKINASRGANLISLRNDKFGFSALREPDYLKPLDNPYLYGAPILFPVNRISGGQFVFEDRTYKFPINEEKTGCHLHGFLHETPFKVVKSDDNFAEFKFTATKLSPYLDFPHEFEISIKYTLTSIGIEQKTSVINNSDTNMPIMLGFHTTFNSAFLGNKNVYVKVDFEREYERNMQNYLPTGNITENDYNSNLLKFGKFNPFSTSISKHFKSTKSMIIYDETCDYSLVYENDSKFEFRLIYNGDANEYICLEPQTCLANAVNSPFELSKTGLICAKPHSKLEFLSEIKLLKGDLR